MVMQGHTSLHMELPGLHLPSNHKFMYFMKKTLILENKIMTLPSHLSEFSGLFTTSIAIDTTNLTLARFSELSKESLEKLLTIFTTSLEGATQARLFANSIAAYSLAVTLFAGFMAYSSSKENVRKVATFLTFAAGLTSVLACFTSAVYTCQIYDFNYWKNICITCLQYTPKNK